MEVTETEVTQAPDQPTSRNKRLFSNTTQVTMLAVVLVVLFIVFSLTTDALQWRCRSFSWGLRG